MKISNFIYMSISEYFKAFFKLCIFIAVLNLIFKDSKKEIALPIIFSFIFGVVGYGMSYLERVYYRRKITIVEEEINSNKISNEDINLNAETVEEVSSERLNSIRTNSKNKKEKIEDIIEELNDYIGLEGIKEEINSLVNYLKIQKVREKKGLPISNLSLHTIFLGPPGTGKTSIARIMGRIYCSLGFLKKGHLVETDRAGLVGGYVGQTAIIVDSVVKESLDGVLFIDEAYSLKKQNSTNDFGQEAIDTLLKRMEDYRGRLVVIAAGYEIEMNQFISSNPGLESRFNRIFNFPNYNAEELLQITYKLLVKSGYEISREAIQEIYNNLQVELIKNAINFGNARYCRNLFEKIIQRQANRLSKLKKIDSKNLTLILPEDVPKNV